MVPEVQIKPYDSAKVNVTPRTAKWCKRCGRKHPSNLPCQPREVEREAKNGKMVKRVVWEWTPPKHKHSKKKVRKS